MVEGEPPTPRTGHSAAALPGDRHLVVFGGGIPHDDIYYSTVSVLDTYTWTWATPLLQVTGIGCAYYLSEAESFRLQLACMGLSLEYC